MLLHAKIRKPRVCGIGLLFHGGAAGKDVVSGAGPAGSFAVSMGVG